MMTELYPLFLDTIKADRLIAKGDTVVSAFSGGKDSVTLLLLLQNLQKDIRFKLVAAYFNHRIREDSEQEQAWVEDFCRSRGVESVMGSEDVIGFKQREGLNLENAASICRYRFLEKTAAAHKNPKIATAHTKSDLSETFFMKLFRGSGIRGLGSIYRQKGERLKIIRPLLAFSTEDILSFLNRNNIPYYSDYTNRQDRFLRNKIRNRLIPEIKKIEPDIETRIFQTVSLVQSEFDYFSQTAGKVLSKTLILGKILPVKALEKYHPALQRHIVRAYLKMLKGDLLNIDFDHIHQVLRQKSKTKGISLPGINLKFQKGYIFPDDIRVPPYHYTVASYGTVRVKEIDRTLSFKESDTFRKPKKHFAVTIPLAGVIFPLTVRNPQKGDRYIKINSSFNQRVFEMIRTSGMPHRLRNLCPVILDGGGAVIWVTGSPVAQSFRVENKHRDQPAFLEISLVR